MNVTKTTTQWTTTQTAEYINLTDKIILVKMTIKSNDEIIKTDYFPAHINNIDNFTQVDYNPNSVQRKFLDFAIMRKEFIEAYRKIVPDFYEFCKEYTIENRDVYEGLITGKITLDDIQLVEICSFDDTIYPFFYGVSKTGWIPHMMPYNWGCYMLTNGEYDLDAVKDFLIYLEMRGEVYICRGDIHDEIIQEIPSYNITGKANRYINFFVLARKKYECDFGTTGIGEYVDEIEKFRI